MSHHRIKRQQRMDVIVMSSPGADEDEVLGYSGTERGLQEYKRDSAVSLAKYCGASGEQNLSTCIDEPVHPSMVTALN